MESRQNLKNKGVSKELLDEQSPALLKELHLLTRDGNLNADARRKLKQVNHLYNLLRPALDDLFNRFEDISILDVGAGKAYLGFILYELSLKSRGKGRVLSVEERKDLVQNGRETASRLGFERMEFIEAKMSNFKTPIPLHLLTALHACDTATDDALISGIKSGAEYIAVVPCCQAEAAELLKKEKDSTLSQLWRHGIHRREFGSHITNVLRSLVLESKGYAVTVTELVGWEHSLKNELILAKKVQKTNALAERQLKETLESIRIRPKLICEFFS